MKRVYYLHTLSLSFSEWVSYFSRGEESVKRLQHCAILTIEYFNNKNYKAIRTYSEPIQVNNIVPYEKFLNRKFDKDQERYFIKIDLKGLFFSFGRISCKKENP